MAVFCLTAGSWPWMNGEESRSVGSKNARCEWWPAIAFSYHQFLAKMVLDGEQL